MRVPPRENITGILADSWLTAFRACTCPYSCACHARAADLSYLGFCWKWSQRRVPLAVFVFWDAADLSCFRLLLKMVATPRPSGSLLFCTFCRDFRRPAATSLYAACPCGAVTFQLAAVTSGYATYPCIDFLSIYLSIYLSIHLSIYLSIYLSIDFSIYLAIYLLIYVSIFVFIYVPTYVSICLSPCVSI